MCAKAAASGIAAIDRPQGDFQVDPGGQATYRIRLETPPGIAGCQPHLELAYSHRQRNGLLGVGWSLVGLSSITRTKATYAVDGFNGCIGFNANDRYMLDGQRLIAVQGEYGGPNTLYFTELQTWKHVLAGAFALDGFVVTTKSGEIFEYGTTADSRILAGSAVRLWALSAIVDRNGNRVEYGYSASPLLADGTRGPTDPGSSYIDRISYNTGPATTASRFVQFVYEQRDDPIADFIGGFPVINSYRLKQIATAVAGDAAARCYTLSYRTSTATHLSCLESIVESGVGGVTLPPLRFAWQDIATPGFEVGPQSQLDQHLAGTDVRAADVSGSGLTDVVQLWADDNGSLNATSYLATPSQNGFIYRRASNSVLGQFPMQREIYTTDINGDGRADLLIAYRSSNATLKLAVCVSNGSGYEDPVYFDTGDPWNPAKHLAFFAADVNGDGRTDFIEAYAHHDADFGDLLYFRSYLSQFGDAPGATFTAAIVSKTSDPAFSPSQLAVWPMDVNGDGMMDLVRVWQRGSDSHMIATAYISVSDGLYDVAFDKHGPVDSDLGVLAPLNQIAFLPTDVNGDGIQDLLQVWQEPTDKGSRLHLTTFLCNAAGGFLAGPDSTFDNQVVQQRAFDMMDFNGGGMTAVVTKWIGGDNQLNFGTFLASPSGQYRLGPTFSAGVVGSNFDLASLHPADVNGDGKGDLLRVAKGPAGETVLTPYLSSGAYPDMVSAFENALGEKTAVTYTPLSDPAVYGQSDDQAFPATSARRYPSRLTPTAFPAEAVLGQAVYVVAQYAESNDASINRFALGGDFAMHYMDARINLLGRGWEGFGTVVRLDKTCGRKTVQNFNLDFPYTGTLASTRVEADGTYATDPRVPKDRTSVLMTLASSQYVAVPRGATLGNPNSQVLEVLRSQMQTEHYDYGVEHFDYAIASTYDYDDYGNVKTHTYLGYVDQQSGAPLDPAEVVYHRNLYRNDVRPDGWALGFLRYAKVTANASDADPTRFLPGDYKLRQQSYLPTTYNLASKSDWDDANGVYLTIGYDYDRFGNRIAETKPGGFLTRYDYDPDYHTFLMRITSPTPEHGAPLVTAYGYDPRFGVEVASRDANGFIAITGLDAFGREACRQGPLPGPQTASDPNAVTSLVTGEPSLRAAFLSALVVTLSTKDHRGGDGSQWTETRALQRFPNDAAREFLWRQSYIDGRGRERVSVVQSGQAAGDVVMLTDYDTDGAVVRKSLPFFSASPIVEAPHAVTTSYDVLGRPLLRRAPAGADGTLFSDTTWFYGTQGAVTETTAEASSEAYTRVLKHHQYDGNNKVRKILVPADGNATTIFQFDPIARLKQATDPATASNPQGVSTIFTYDSTDRRLTLDDPDQNTTGNPEVKAMTYAYDAITGRLRRQINAAAQATIFAYDNLGRVTTKNLSGGRTIAYTYDDPTANGLGRLTRVFVTGSNGSTESRYDFGYDPYGNTCTTTLSVAGEASDFVTRSIFDPQKRTVRQTLPDASELLREYSLGQLVCQTLDGARIDYPLDRYDATGQARTIIGGQGILPGGGVVADYTFNPAGQLYAEVVSGSVGKVVDVSYGYDLLNQLLDITDQLSLGGTQSQAFTYLNKRLKTAAVPEFGTGTYAYDASGNIVSKDGVDYVCRGHFPVSGSGTGGQVYSAVPDACGNTKTRTTNGMQLSFDYDGIGRLCRVRTGTGETIREILSDYLGHRLRQINADGTQIIFVNPIYQLTRGAQGSSVTKYLVDARGVVAAITTGPASRILYFRRDHKGSTTHTFGADGTVASRIVYGGYGEPRLVSGPDDFRPKYERRGWDPDIGLYYFGARYYDPMIGRFMTPDDQLGGASPLQADVLNRYAFELNNPVNLVDPTGHAGDWIAGLVFGLLIVVVATAIVLSGGAATPLAAAGVGALLGAGLNSTIYSATHTSESGGKFWGGWAADVAVGALIGGITGGAFAGLGSAAESATANIASRWGQFGVRAAIYGIGGAAVAGPTDAFNQYMSNVIDRNIVGKDVDLDEGVLRAFYTGLAVGGVAGILQAGAEARMLGLPRQAPAEEQGVEMVDRAARGPSERTGLLAEAQQRNYAKLPETFRTRAILFGLGQSAAVTDATLEAEGY
jgi:RHS repeat-associated protein